MPTPPRILVLPGSTRTESFNKKLSRLAAAAVTAAGGEVTLVDLRELPMPLYDGDLEASSGLPENAKKLKQLFVSHAGLLFAAPEYNSSITGVLKNAIDWVSRPEPKEPPLVAFTGKVAALVSASPGALGGLRGLVHLRSILGNIGALVLPEQLSIPKANEAFDAGGALVDAKHKATLERICKQLVATVGKLAG
jgi:NAD(P)H-dependent FMN reductase